MSGNVVANDWSLRSEVVSAGGHEELRNCSRGCQGGGSLVHPSACQCGSKNTVQSHSRFAGRGQHQDATGPKVPTCHPGAYHCPPARSYFSDQGGQFFLSWPVSTPCSVTY